jgi:hypothetical protein
MFISNRKLASKLKDSNSVNNSIIGVMHHQQENQKSLITNIKIGQEEAKV